MEIKFFVRKFCIARVWEMSRNIRRRERPGFLGRERFRVIVEQTETEETDEWTLWRWNTGTVHCAPPVPLSVQTARIPSVLERHAGHFTVSLFFSGLIVWPAHIGPSNQTDMKNSKSLYFLFTSRILLSLLLNHLLLILSCWSKFDINWIKFNNSD